MFLSGEGFYAEGWAKTLQTICRNRRVFKGNNLIVKGATYGAKEFFYMKTLKDYIISCKGRTRVRVTMSVKHKERDSMVTLSDIGDYWYQAKSKTECIMEEPTEAVFEILKRNFYIYKNSRATMICILQTVCPTAIFNFPFSTFN